MITENPKRAKFCYVNSGKVLVLYIKNTFIANSVSPYCHLTVSCNFAILFRKTVSALVIGNTVSIRLALVYIITVY
jgi:hypothetical protein